MIDLGKRRTHPVFEVCWLQSESNLGIRPCPIAASFTDASAIAIRTVITFDKIPQHRQSDEVPRVIILPGGHSDA